MQDFYSAFPWLLLFLLDNQRHSLTCNGASVKWSGARTSHVKMGLEFDFTLQNLPLEYKVPGKNEHFHFALSEEQNKCTVVRVFLIKLNRPTNLNVTSLTSPNH